MSRLSREQIAMLVPVKTEPIAIPIEVWNPALDEETEGMFGRRWDDLEKFSSLASRVYHLLNWTTLLGNYPETGDIPLLVSIATSTGSELLRAYALDGLKQHLRDVSGESPYRDVAKQTIAPFERKPHNEGSKANIQI